MIDQADRVFHLEVLRGGMNRLLFRSNKSDTWQTRVEILFMNVKYLAVGTLLQGPVIERLGSVEECADRLPWLVDHPGDLSVFLVHTQEGEGVVVAGSVALDESKASPSDPSAFFMLE